jgi:uncharacterized protein YndB with AHSA1/START domain
MQKLHFSVSINTPKEKVWDIMLGDRTYREWTKVFNPSGSYFEGSWDQGSKILFLGTDPETGKMGGWFLELPRTNPMSLSILNT